MTEPGKMERSESVESGKNNRAVPTFSKEPQESICRSSGQIEGQEKERIEDKRPVAKKIARILIMT